MNQSSICSCVAIITCRNEEVNLRRFLPLYIKEGLSIFIIDHSSTDSSKMIIDEYMGKGIIGYKIMEYDGKFSLKKQLEIKQEVINTLTHDWVIHLDADEFIQSNRENESIQEAITRIDSEGYNAINFDEFVFLPIKNNFSYYYFFDPCSNNPRRIIAWKRSFNFTNINSGGHKLDKNFNLKLYHENLIMRHFIVNNQLHAVEKYSNRSFCKKEITMGWHRNRLNIPKNKLIFPDIVYLKYADFNTKKLEKNDSKKKTLLGMV